MNLQNINCDSPCPFLEAVLLCSFIAEVPKQGRENPVLQGGKGCWALHVDQAVTGSCKVGLCSCCFFFIFTFFNKLLSLTVWKKFLFFCTLLYRVLLYHFLLHCALSTNDPIFSPWLVYLHFIVVDWVFLGNLLKSLRLSLYWDSFLGQDHCLHMTYNFFLGSIFWWCDHPQTVLTWMLCKGCRLFYFQVRFAL